MEESKNRGIFRCIFICLCMLLFFAWSVLFLHDTNSIQRNVFFKDTNDWFMDFYNTVYYSVSKTPYSWGWIPARNYFPFSYLILFPFSRLYPYDVNNWESAYQSRYAQLSAIGGGYFLVISFGVLFYCLYRCCKGREWEKLAILISLFCSSIVAFNFDRANEIILSAAFLIVFLMTYHSENKVIKHIGYLFLAMSAAMKIFPAIYGVLLLYEKRYKDAFITIIYGILFTFLPFFWLNGHLLDNIRLFGEALKAHSIAYANGFFGINSATIFPIYINLQFTPWIMLILTVLFTKNLKEEWKKNLLITMAFFMTSGQQSFYCLIFLFYPIILYLNENHARKQILFLIGFILILSPLQYEYTNSYININNKTVINTVCIVFYIVLLIEAINNTIKSRKSSPFLHI